MISFFLRTGKAVGLGIFSKPRHLTAPYAISFRIWPWDTDDFTMLAAPQYANFGGSAAWGHGTVGGFLKAAFRHKWYVVTRRSTFEYYRPVRMFRKVRIETKLVSRDEYSVLRLFEFFDGQKLVGRGYLQLVVLNGSFEKIPSVDWLNRIGNPLDAFQPWPPELDYWQYRG
jgi:acyl-CoA thioesterase FadM